MPAMLLILNTQSYGHVYLTMCQSLFPRWQTFNVKSLIILSPTYSCCLHSSLNKFKLELPHCGCMHFKSPESLLRYAHQDNGMLRGKSDTDLWPFIAKSNQFIPESKYKFVSSLKKSPQGIYEMLYPQEWDRQPENNMPPLCLAFLLHTLINATDQKQPVQKGNVCCFCLVCWGTHIKHIKNYGLSRDFMSLGTV